MAKSVFYLIVPVAIVVVAADSATITPVEANVPIRTPHLLPGSGFLYEVQHWRVKDTRR